MNVSAVIVTRGDVDLSEITENLGPLMQEVFVWDKTYDEAHGVGGVYGRYAGIGYTTSDLIYVQDDDCVLPPESITKLVDTWRLLKPPMEPWLVANMPEPFRAHYSDSCLVGFGAVFHRDLPARAFARFAATLPTLGLTNYSWWLPGEEKFNRECDTVFTALTPRVLIDVPYENLPWASDSNRLWKQPGHVEERARMLELVRKVVVRDG